jgi:hypothetical protein
MNRKTNEINFILNNFFQLIAKYMFEIFFNFYFTNYYYYYYYYYYFYY